MKNSIVGIARNATVRQFQKSRVLPPLIVSMPRLKYASVPIMSLAFVMNRGFATSKNTVEADDDNYAKVISQGRVIVDAWAGWCRPCIMLAPILEKAVEGTNVTLVKINMDENPNFAMKYRISALPTIKAFKDGVEVGGFVGMRDEKSVKQFVDELSKL